LELFFFKPVQAHLQFPDSFLNSWRVLQCLHNAERTSKMYETRWLRCKGAH
jgi:hypothetical protein